MSSDISDNGVGVGFGFRWQIQSWWGHLLQLDINFFFIWELSSCLLAIYATLIRLLDLLKQL